MLFLSFAPLEEKPVAPVTQKETTGKMNLLGVFLLCACMFCYVGFENGFAFFVTSYFQDVLASDHAYLALSLFWLAMIPSRILVGLFASKGRTILLITSLGALIFSLALSLSQNGIAGIVLAFPLGFFCGAVFPSCLSRSLEFGGSKAATVTGWISAAAGLGGAVMGFSTGACAQSFGLFYSLVGLSLLLAILTGLALVLFFKKDKTAEPSKVEKNE
jgi:FHS family glucose/mannose:H+ symporter-like MFS transporter